MFPFPPITGDPIVDTIIWSEELSSDESEQSQQSSQATTVQETREPSVDYPRSDGGVLAIFVLGFLVFALIFIGSFLHWLACRASDDNLMTLEEFKRFKKLHAANKRRWDRR